MAAASSVMEKRPLIREGGGKEVEDMLREEWVGGKEVGLEVEVVFVGR